jgi:serine/threonine-protein kinase PpkA
MSGAYICATCIDTGATLLDQHGNKSELVRDISELTFLLQDPKLAPELQLEYKQRVQRYAIAARKRKHEGAGDVIAGGRLLRPIGAGAFATVWEAEIVRPSTRGEVKGPIAVKIFDQDKLAQGLMLWRFHRGIRAMRLFSELGRRTPGSIVKLFEVGDDLLSFSMEYLAGGDLHNLLERGLTIERRILLFRQVADAVSFAHAQGVIHRDIKPANVVLRQDGSAVLTDFDIADLSFATTQSVYASSLGTPLFAAPEQLADARLAAHPSADIYSLGKLLYFLVAQKPPPLGSIEEGHIPSYLRDVRPTVIQAAVCAALRSQPEDRPQSVGALLALIGLEPLQVYT